MLTRPVLIQPNLRFFHELFGWEVELARREAEDRQRLADQMRQQGLTAGPGGDIVSPGGPTKREILYAWPSFCRDLVSYTVPRRGHC
jgi:dual specificity MAP kinase phosphatase